MHRIERSALLPYRREDVFEVVRDVARYPEFLRWCKEARVLESTEDEVVASMVISARGHVETMVTRNQMAAPQSITLELVKGPFSTFAGAWTLTALGEVGCRVSLWVEFDIRNPVISVMVTPFLGKIADTIVDAFADRARSLLGASGA